MRYLIGLVLLLALGAGMLYASLWLFGQQEGCATADPTGWECRGFADVLQFGLLIGFIVSFAFAVHVITRGVQHFVGRTRQR